MSRPRRTARVTIEDLFAEMGPDMRADILESLRTIDRIKGKAEAKDAGIRAQTMAGSGPLQKLDAATEAQ